MEVKEPSEHIDFVALARNLDLRLTKALGRQAWLAQTPSGTTLVIKSGSGASVQLYDFLIKFKTLFPPFDYPRVISGEPGFYLVYDFIPGTPLSEGDFESEAAQAAAFELSGRVNALFRSLRLAPMFQGLHHHATSSQDTQGVTAQRLAALGSGLDCQVDGLALHRWEASQSYAWAQGILPYCLSRWPGEDAGLTARWPDLGHRVETVTSIHLVAPGSHLAHTCFTPEHLLCTGNDRWGVVGWQVAPRPYNYMRYKYLAWCLVHTVQGDIEKRYRFFLDAMPAIQSCAANSLTFVLSLLETWMEIRGPIELKAEKLQALYSFMDEALAVSNDDKAQWQKA